MVLGKRAKKEQKCSQFQTKIQNNDLDEKIEWNAVTI